MLNCPKFTARHFFGVHLVRDHSLILFADYFSVTAYGANSGIWRSEQLCWGDLKIVGVDGDQIIGCGYAPTSSSEGRFALGGHGMLFGVLAPPKKIIMGWSL